MAPSFKPWMLVSAAWIGPAALAAVNEMAQRRINGDPPASLAMLVFASADWLVYAILTPAVFVIARRWPLSRPHAARHVVLHAIVSLGFCAAWAGAGAWLRARIVPETLWGGSIGEHVLSWTFITLPFGVAIYFGLVGVEHAIRYFLEARDRELQVARLSQQLAGARFAALRAQLNPHFLFNTLNTIAVLVRDNDKAAATAIVEHLSNVLRRTLSRHRTDEVPLDEEMNLVGEYLAIEQARFSDRLRVSIEVPSSVRRAAVPSFAVQHLVENAIRHGIARRADAGRLTISAERSGDALAIAITDDGPGLEPGAASARGGGLDNTRERLHVLYGARGSLAVTDRPGGGVVAVLRVPYREIEDADDADE